MRYTVKLKDDFKDLLAYQRWLKEKFENLSNENQMEKYRFTEDAVNRRSPDWFGKNASFEILNAGVTQYQSPELLDELYHKVKDKLPVGIYDKLPKKKLKFNALGLGVFSFDRAAMTLYKNKEFYSPSKHSKVDERDVIQKGTNYYHTNDQSKIIQRWEENANGNLKIRTNTKDLFSFFPKIQSERHAVEFFVGSDAAASKTASEMIYNGVSSIVMAELLMLAGIKVKINVVVGSATNKLTTNFVGCIIPIKDYDETLDRNLIALMTSDPRFMRFDIFKGIIASFDHFDMKTPSGLGYATNARELKKLLEESGYTKKLKSKHRFYFGGTFNEKAAIRDIENTIDDVANALQYDIQSKL